MRTLEELSKKELIKLVRQIRPKADLYDRVCECLDIKGNILGYVNRLRAKVSKKSNAYLIETTTRDQWEMSRGVYIIYARNKAKARAVFLSLKKGESIVDIELLNPKGEKAVYIQAPTIE